MPILGLAPNRHRALHAQGGEDELLEVRPLILALTISHLEGEVLRLGKLILTPDTAGGGIKVHIASLQVNPRDRSDGTVGKEPHRAEVVETIEDASHRIIGTGMRREWFTQEACGVVVREE